MAVDRACWVGRAGRHGRGADPRLGRGRSRAHRHRMAGAAGRRRQEDRARSRHRRRSTPSSATTWPTARRSTPATSRPSSPSADLVVEDTFDFGRHTAVSLEPRALLAAYDKSTGKLTIHTSSQCPHMIQRVFAQHAGHARPQRADRRPRRRRLVRPQDPHLRRRGGGDGGGHRARPSRQVHRRPPRVVRLRHPRPRELRQGAHGREQVRRDLGPSTSTCCRAPAPTRNIRAPACSRPTRSSTSPAGPTGTSTYRARATVVYLNKPPTSQYRAVGHPIGNAVGEHLVDRAAAALGIDPDRDPPPQRHARRWLSRRHRQRHQAQGPVAPALPRCAGRAHGLRRAAQGAGGACASKGIHRGIGIACFIKGTSPGPAGLLRHRRRADLARRTPAPSSSSPTAASSARWASPSRARAPIPSWARSPPRRSACRWRACG